MEELREMLQKKYPAIDFSREQALMTDGLLDSLAVVEIISEIEERFDLRVTMEYIQPERFESVERMWEMIEELRQ